MAMWYFRLGGMWDEGPTQQQASQSFVQECQEGAIVYVDHGALSLGHAALRT